MHQQHRSKREGEPLGGHCPGLVQISRFCGGIKLSTRMNQIKINVLLSFQTV